jgi:HTH-type transcriptional regulator/antitoxin HigA
VVEVRPIRTEADYTAALADIEQYFDNEPEPGTPESDRFDVLSTLIAAYERERWPIEAPDAVTAIAEVMAIRGYKRADLADLLGSKSRASEIMNRKRPLTIDQARKLHYVWHVPAASLLEVPERISVRAAVDFAGTGSFKSNAKMIEDVLRAAAPRALTRAEIQAALQREKGVSLGSPSIRDALGELVAHHAVEQVGASRRWRLRAA